MPEPQPLVLSASSIKTYLDCGYKYLMSNVWLRPAPPNMDMAIGTAVHAGVEALHKGLDPREQGELMSFALDQEWPGDDVEFGKAETEALAMLAVYRKKVTFKPNMVERDFVMKVNGVVVSGRIDAASDVTDEVHDTKTTRALSSFNIGRHRFQMTLYRWGFQSITGRLPKRLVLDILARNGHSKSVEVQADDQEFADVLRLASEGIIRGEFEPTGALNGSCGRCPYLEVCTYARVD